MSEDDEVSREVVDAEQAVREVQSDVDQLLDQYSSICSTITAAVESRVFNSLSLSCPQLNIGTLLFLLQSPSLTAQSLISTLKSESGLTDETQLSVAVILRLQQKYRQLIELQQLISALKAGEADTEGFQQLESRMINMGIITESSNNANANNQTDTGGT